MCQFLHQSPSSQLRSLTSLFSKEGLFVFIHAHKCDVNFEGRESRLNWILSQMFPWWDLLSLLASLAWVRCNNICFHHLFLSSNMTEGQCVFISASALSSFILKDSCLQDYSELAHDLREALSHSALHNRCMTKSIVYIKISTLIDLSQFHSSFSAELRIFNFSESHVICFAWFGTMTCIILRLSIYCLHSHHMKNVCCVGYEHSIWPPF